MSDRVLESPPSRAQVRELLARAVEEKGADYVYERPNERTCLYFRDGEPSCIVGHVLSYLGFSSAAETGLGEGAAASSVFAALGVVDDGLLNALASAQDHQDAGCSWGRALSAFDAELARFGGVS